MKLKRDGDEINYECSCGEKGNITLFQGNSNGKPYCSCSYPCLGCGQQILVMANFNDNSVLMAEGKFAEKEIFP